MDNANTPEDTNSSAEPSTSAEPHTPASSGGGEHTLETAAQEGGGGYGGPFPVDPEQEQAGSVPEDAGNDDSGSEHDGEDDDADGSGTTGG